MKKALSLLLSLVLLFSAGTISTNAAETSNSKLTPELQEAIDALSESDTVNIVVYFAEKTLRISDMPDWDPSPDASPQSTRSADLRHSEYIANHNYEITRQIFEPCASCRKFIHPTTGKTYYTQVDFTLDGCCTARGITLSDLDAICASPLVKSVGLYRIAYSGKYDPNLAVMLDAVDPDDWIEVGVHRAGYFKSVDEMPSWPTMPSSPSEAGSTPSLSREEMLRRIDAARNEYAAYVQEVGQAFYAEAFESVEVRYQYQGGNQANVIVKAGDIETIASRDIVKDIEYAYNAIVESDLDPPDPEEKIDKKLKGNTILDCDYLPVYIELDIDVKQLQDMPSWPDDAKAGKEYTAYLYQKVKPLYDAALADLDNISQTTRARICDADAPDRYSIGKLTHVRSVCYNAFTAYAPNDYEVFKALAASGWVKSIRYFEEDNEWVTDRSRYDGKNQTTRYLERLLSQYGYLEKTEIGDLQLYQELAFHSDNTAGGCDWALAAANFGTIVTTEMYYQVVGGRLLEAPGYKEYPFTFRIGLYDAKQDKFFDLIEINFDDYPDLYEVWQQLDIGGMTDKEQRGDADGDREVSILDATKIQRGIAGLESKNNIVAAGADADGDGEMTVLDATRIQRFKADLCSLDGSPFAAAG